jgi:hypothetical protein
MSKAEQTPCLVPWNMAAPQRGENKPAGIQAFVPDEDCVVWPPVIARIRDLDLPLIPQNRPSPPVAQSPAPSKFSLLKIADRRRWSQNISSRLIALAGIVIFLAGIVPFMHLRDEQTVTDPADKTSQSITPAPKADLVPSLLGGAAATVEQNKKTSSQLVNTSPASLTTKTPAATAIPPSVPPLLPPPEKKESPLGLTAKLPEKTPLPPAVTAVEQIATAPAAVRAGVSAPTNLPGTPSPLMPPSSGSFQVTEIGEFSPLPNAQPNAPPKIDPTVADLRGAPRPSYDRVPDYRNNPQMLEQLPPANVRGPAIQPQPWETYPNQPAPVTFPAAQPPTSYPSANRSSGAAPSGSYQPLPAARNYPGNPGPAAGNFANPAGTYRDGVSIPPTTTNPPTRYEDLNR